MITRPDEKSSPERARKFQGRYKAKLAHRYSHHGFLTDDWRASLLYLQVALNYLVIRNLI
jgi:hypothetical protein